MKMIKKLVVSVYANIMYRKYIRTIGKYGTMNHKSLIAARKYYDACYRLNGL